LDLRLKEFLESKSDRIEKLVFVEQNYSGQLETHLSPRLGLNRITSEDFYFTEPGISGKMMKFVGKSSTEANRTTCTEKLFSSPRGSQEREIGMRNSHFAEIPKISNIRSTSLYPIFEESICEKV
ncbi:MAG: hypothetical protein PHH70_00005, partial [Candidatus Gracilibacteria bacterium]|nr:hypothetical protein [Candidatus Gracilibacteria bacterium]